MSVSPADQVQTLARDLLKRQRRPLILYLFAGLFLISGGAGLIYEIVWERLLALYFGVTMISVTLIVSAYMAGLGIGSLLGGRVARNFQNTLLLYGLLEIGIALFGVLSPRLIIWIGQATAGSPYPFVFLISFAILLIPTTLMGMTLPLLTQSFVDRVEGSGQVIGLLYGINTLGAAFGALLSGYVLVGLYGFEGAVYLAVFMNALVGLFAFLLSRSRSAILPESKAEEATAVPAIPWGYRTILLSSFWVGFIGLGFEMLWIRVLMLVDKNTAYGFPSVLFIFLLGLALGGYFWGRWADSAADLVALFCKIEVTAAIGAAFTFLLFDLSLPFHPPWIQNFFETQKPLPPFFNANGEFLFSRRMLLKNLCDYFLPILILVLPPCLILGGGLTILDRLSINNPLLSGRRVGDIHLANILGSVAGALVISFLLLPAIGSEWTLKLLVLSTLGFPALYFLDRAGGGSMPGRETSLILLCLAALVGIALLPGRNQFYQRLYAAGTGHDVRISESGDSVLALTFAPGNPLPGNRGAGIFWIGGEINSFFPPDGTYESRAQVCAGAAKPERVLVIGFGGGYSTLFFRSLPGVDEIVVVELLADIAPFLSSHLDSARHTLSDPRLTYIVDDGRRYLNAFPEEKFDLISIDPLRDHTAGHNNLYSEEALTIYRRHLLPDGVLCAWMDEFHIIPHTTARVFPYVDQFRNEFMVAGDQPILYDRRYMDQAAESYAGLLRDVYEPDLEIALNAWETLQFFIRDQDQILHDEKDTKFLRDMDPWLEYYLFRPPTSVRIRQNPEGIQNFESRIQK